MRRIYVAWLLSVGIATGAAAQPPPSTFDPALRRAEARGAEIFRHDRAARVATDVLRGLPWELQRRVQGWVTEDRDGGALLVTFVGLRADGATSALLSLPVTAEGRPGRRLDADPSGALSPAQQAQFRARQLAIGSGFQRCSDAYNTVLLPGRADGAAVWHVYLLPGTTRPDVVLAGGTHRIDVNEAGTVIVGRRAFTRACLELPNEAKAAFLMVTHMLDPAPTEIHVFLSLLAGKPLLVATANRYAWMVDTGVIRFMYKVD